MPSRRLTLAALLLVSVAAFAARLLPIFLVPGINHPDEIFQSLEPAHRLIFGFGLHTGTSIRSWILPGAIVAPMWLGSLFGDGPGAYVPAVQIALALLACSAVVCCYLWAARWHGAWAGLAAAILPAFWPDAVYFAGRSLSEPVAASILVIALYLLEPGDFVTSRRRLALGGALLALAFVIRIQMAPAVAVITLWTWARAPRQRFLPLAGGIVGLLALSGGLDTVTAGYPFAPAWLNFITNVSYDVASSFGTAPWYAYLTTLLHSWSGGGVVLLILAALGARRVPLLPVTALVILASHSVIPHKEYRFIYPAILLLLVGAGLGLAQLAAWIGKAMQRHGASPGFGQSIGALAAGAVAGLLSLGQALSADNLLLWHKGEDTMRASALISRLPSVCGIGTNGIYWWDTGGYTFFHRDVPFYWPLTEEQFAHDAPGFDTMLTPRRAPPLQGYETRQCFGSVCVAQRPGGCRPVPMAPLPSPFSGNVFKPRH